MKKRYILSLCYTLALLLGITSITKAQTTVTGTVYDDKTGETLVGASVLVKGAVGGIITDIDGKFTLQTATTPPFNLAISFAGYNGQEVAITQNNQTVEVRLKEQGIMMNDVVISASRVEERILESPVSIEKLDAVAIRQTSSANFYDAIENMKGVQLNTNSLTFKSVNTRGFATFANTRFVQVIDGMDNAAPGLNFPAGNLVGISELDVQNMELIPGAASALYGPNAFNGIMFINSKSPFDAQGLSVMVRNGMTVQEPSGDLPGTNWFGDYAIRYAKAFKNKFAFKINLAALQGRDWYATDYSDSDTNPINAAYRGPNSPSYNGVNIYGDEIATTLYNTDLPIPGLPPLAIRVARTGYTETDLSDTEYLARSYRGDAALHYRINDNLEILYNYRIGFGNSIYQGANRYALKNLNLQQHKIELKGGNYFLRAYTTIENAGDSYDMKFAAWNINRAWKSDVNWFRDYTLGYIPPLLQGLSPIVADSIARVYADAGRLLPGTPEFEQVRDSIISIADLATGAKFIDKTNLRHVEGMYNFNKHFDFVELLVGGNFRQYNLNSQGTIFTDADGSIKINEYGAFAQVAKKLLQERLKLTGSLRYDKNQNFTGRVSPRISAVYSLGENRQHNIRASYQTGFRNPDTQSQYIGLDLGVVTLVGGTQENVNDYTATVYDAQGNAYNIPGINLYENSYTAASVSAFEEAVVNSRNAGMTLQEAGAANIGLLQKSNVAYIKPERIQSAEVGYKSVINNKLLVDFNVYYNLYNDFQANTYVRVPYSGSVGATSGMQDILSEKYRTFQLYSNATGTVHSYGAGINLGYMFPKGYRIETNLTYNDFGYDTDTNPDLVPGFNTPKYRFNIGIGNREVVKNLGFQINFRWLDEYEWEASFGNGHIDSYNVTDAQVTYKIPKIKTILKVGGANIFNQTYRQAFGASAIGAQYYIALTFDEMFK